MEGGRTGGSKGGGEGGMEEGQYGGEAYPILTDAHIHSPPQSTCFHHILPVHSHCSSTSLFRRSLLSSYRDNASRTMPPFPSPSDCFTFTLFS